MVLAAFRILNAPEDALPKEAVSVLCEGPPRAFFVFDPSIAAELLRSPVVVPTSGVHYYEVVSGLPRSEFPVLSEAFEQTPLSLSGDAHRAARAKVVSVYRRVEAGIEQWVDGFCAEYLQDLRSRASPDIIEAASDFSDRVSRAMAAAELGIRWQDLPTVPNEIFVLFPSAARIRNIEERFVAIKEKVVSCLKDQGRSEDDFWPIFTLMMMNRDAMQGTILYMFSHLQGGAPAGSAAECAAAAANVSLLQCRQVLQDREIAGRAWRSGDLLYIAPFLLHRREPPPVGTDFTFGYGPHACPGRKLSLRMLESLITAMRREPLPEGFFPRAPRLHRQLVLMTGKK